ncbi:hypothetical protein DEU56DRAFT_797543 [Suillus clintonianus]|uniref:uncharacterized protein n=1 Tax=Suillus clintonianus TaxID=1904413 RepID=UPI001B8790DA|nr:uncharacterized protein DEU56DRAFT_797543 [Suillus clintonianus]KAG2140587.1 hypothetical protein DEU56DRAFT_797543 [Suillus clintonianus]
MKRHSRPCLSVPAFIGVLIVFSILAGLALKTLSITSHPDLFLPTTLDDSQSPLNVTSEQGGSPGVDPELDALHHIVSRTKGFYARDYSLWLGWNNMRYIIEAAVLHGRILNRTTIIPTYVYARACEFDNSVCAAYATMVNRGDATGSDEWRQLPIEQQMAWKTPVSLMFNLTHLRETHAVITVSEYLRLHNISADVETTDGHWDTDLYHRGVDIFSDSGVEPSLYAIENGWYDADVVRVDQLPHTMRERGGWNVTHGQVGSWTNITEETPLSLALHDVMASGASVLDWDTVLSVVGDDTDPIEIESRSDGGIASTLEGNGWEVLYTYGGVSGSDATKDVAVPIRQAAPRNSLRGLYEDFGSIEQDVLLLKGEVHLGRKPGALKFTTLESQERYTQTVLYDFRLTDSVVELADQLSKRMVEKVGGRMWMGGHMRRGDFATLKWTMEPSIEAHLARIKRHLRDGRDILHSVHRGPLHTYKVPFGQADPTPLLLDPPALHDQFYIATDERDPANLTYLRDQGAVLISDLLTIDDRRTFGWPLMLTDVLSLVEQATLAHASYFYAHAHSSVAGGVVNLRASHGADPRTALLEY